MSPTLSQQHEDYLERMYEVLKEKGSVRAVDIAERLNVTPASVTQMLKRLENEGYVQLERYRGFRLTAKGEKAGKRIGQRHRVLTQFLERLHLPKKVIDKDIEGLEHYLSDATVSALEKLIEHWPNE